MVLRGRSISHIIINRTYKLFIETYSFFTETYNKFFTETYKSLIEISWILNVINLAMIKQ